MGVCIINKQVPPELCTAGARERGERQKSSLTTWRLIVTSTWLDLHVTRYRSKNERSSHDLMGSPSPTYNNVCISVIILLTDY